jgi:hypothetical protein
MNVYDTLYRSNNTAPEILAVVQRLSNPRGGGADLANHDEIFARTALTESGERPQYLLRVDRHGLHHWPEYTSEVSRWHAPHGKLGLWQRSVTVRNVVPIPATPERRSGTSRERPLKPTDHTQTVQTAFDFAKQPLRSRQPYYRR